MTPKILRTLRLKHDIDDIEEETDAKAVTMSWWCGLVDLKTMTDFCASHGVTITWTNSECLLKFPDGSTAQGEKNKRMVGF